MKYNISLENDKVSPWISIVCFSKNLKLRVLNEWIPSGFLQNNTCKIN